VRQADALGGNRLLARAAQNGSNARVFGLLRNSRKTDSLRAAKSAESRLLFGAARAAFALLRNSRKTDSLRAAKSAESRLSFGAARAAFALLSLFLVAWPVWAQQQYLIKTVAGGAPLATPAPAQSAIGNPRAVALDSSGNVYFSTGNVVYKLDGSGNLTVVAGNSHAGYSGDGNQATAAQLNAPRGLVLDSAGNLYIADTGNNVVRMVTPAGVISTIVGTGFAGFFGDGGPATGAELNQPYGLAFDGSGNLYIADAGNSVVRKVSNGTINTFAGLGASRGYTGDTGAANAAQLSFPVSIAFDSSGNAYIADDGNYVIREVSGGNINTIIGNGTQGFAGDGIAATSGELNEPNGLQVDSSGNLYFADQGNSRVRKFTKSNSQLSTVAGNGSFGFSGDGSGATNALLNNPYGIALASSGNIYIADYGNARIRLISGSNISTVAGNGQISFSGDGGQATSAQLNQPDGVAVDSAGNLYISDKLNQRIRKVSGGVITTIAGTGTAGYTGDGGSAANAQVNQPAGLATDTSGNIYVADTLNHAVREITPTGNITTIAGTGVQGYAGDGGSAMGAQLRFPSGVAVDQAGNIYIADTGNHVVRKIINGTITTLAGNGFPGFNGDGGQAASAQLNRPLAVAVDAAGNVYIADSGNVVVREVSPKGIITTVAGNGSVGKAPDGSAAASSILSGVQSVAVDPAGDIFIVGTVVQFVDPTGTLYTVAGDGRIGYSGDGGPSTGAEFNGVSSVALDGNGNVYLADTNNNAVREMQSSGGPILLTGVVNAASNASSAVAPGEIVVLFGSGLGPSHLNGFQLNGSGLVGTYLAGTSVLFNGIAAPILYTSSGQVAAVVPYEIAASSVVIQAEYQGQISNPLTVSLAPAVPGLFTADSSGKGQVVAINQDGTVNAPGNPAAAGSTVILYATGGGQTTPPSVDGQPTGQPLPQSNITAIVTMGGVPATVLYTGGAPGLVAGLLQIDVQIPSNLPAGSAAISLIMNAVTSPAGTTITVAGN
jgi:uncharacterized protein (TIGR03437 family)